MVSVVVPGRDGLVNNDRPPADAVGVAVVVDGGSADVLTASHRSAITH
jgi:hypothetical protein